MSTITDERKQELIADYADLKTALAKIDNKYSLSYIEPELDLPSTLGLQPLVFTPQTQEQLTEAANTQLAEKYSKLQRTLDKNYENALANLQSQTASETESHRKKLAELAADYSKKLDEFYHRAVNNGILYSSLKTDIDSDLSDDYSAKVTEQTTHHNAVLAAISEKSEDITTTYNSDVSELSTRKTAEVAQVVVELTEKQEKNRIAIEKYNQSLEEKEVKYQASCKKSMRAAVEAEYERGLQAARLFAELGESGVRQQLLAEKLYYTEAVFRTYTKDEAQYVMSLDSYLSTSLETSYSALQDFVDYVLT